MFRGDFNSCQVQLGFDLTTSRECVSGGIDGAAPAFIMAVTFSTRLDILPRRSLHSDFNEDVFFCVATGSVSGRIYRPANSPRRYFRRVGHLRAGKSVVHPWRCSHALHRFKRTFYHPYGYRSSHNHEGKNICQVSLWSKFIFNPLVNEYFTFPSQAIELNATKIFRESSFSGHDYLRNLIHLPFYLQNSGLRKIKLAEQVFLAF